MKLQLSEEKAENIFKEYADYVYRTVLYITKSKEMADDVTQETFIQAFKKYDAFNASKPLKPWLYKIALNITRNMLRKQKWLGFMEELPERSCLDLVESSVIRNEEESALWKKINGLSLKNREVIILHFYSGLKLTEIAYSLGIPVGTCKSRLNSALNALRKEIASGEIIFTDKKGDLYGTI